MSPPNDAPVNDVATDACLSEGLRYGDHGPHGFRSELDVPPAFVIVDAPNFLSREMPAMVVRDAKGRLLVDAPFRHSVSGRQRRDVDDVLSLSGLGTHIVAAMFVRAEGRSDRAWQGYSVGARLIATSIRGLGLSGCTPTNLPKDLFGQIEVWLRKRDGVTTLRDATRSALNAARWLMGAVPGCAHVDRKPDVLQSSNRPQWSMKNGTPEPLASSSWGDAETELFLKQCSSEVLGKVAGWNQLAGFMSDGVVGVGPHSRDELTVAAAMLRISLAMPPSWQSLVLETDVANALRALSLRIVERWSELAEKGGELEPAQRRTVVLWREINSGNPGRRRVGGNWYGATGIVRAGWHAAIRVAYPMQEDMAPFAALLAVQSRINVEPLMTISDIEFGIAEADCDPAGAMKMKKRLRGAPYKGRSHRPYPVDFPVTLELDDPAPIVEFVRAWTAGLREKAGLWEESLFLFISDLWHSGFINSFAKVGNRAGFPLELEALCARAEVPRITPRELRRIGIDLVHDACDGDPVTMLAAGNWSNLETGERYYFGPSIVMRGQESLGWAAKIEARRLDWGIETVGRPRGGDLFSATDGFRCTNPLDGPDPQEPGEICRARGQCAICPNADVDVADPAWSFAQMVALADHISDRLAGGELPEWIARFEPVLCELSELWLPFFPDEVVREARRLPRIEYKELGL